MSLKQMFTRLFYQKEDDVITEPHEYVCPKCGSTRIGSLSTIGNFVEVMTGDARPRYVNTLACMDCGFKSSSNVGDNSDAYTKPFEGK